MKQTGRITSPIVALFAALQLAVGCPAAQQRPDAPATEKRTKKQRAKRAPPLAVPGGDALVDGEVQEGIASYYSDKLRGRPTASGAPYDPEDATCAHRSLPFGTVLRIEDLETGRSATCVVNDRGPFVEGRIVDVSGRLARELDLKERGVARVRIVVQRPGGDS